MPFHMVDSEAVVDRMVVLPQMSQQHFTPFECAPSSVEFIASELIECFGEVILRRADCFETPDGFSSQFVVFHNRLFPQAIYN